MLNFQFSSKNWQLEIENFLSISNSNYEVKNEMRENVLFYFNVKLKIEWHFCYTD